VRGRAGLEAELEEERSRRRAAGLERELPPPEAAPAADFTSNDYLGLARHPAVIAGARRALETWGAGGRASRLLGGGSELDRAAERAAAEWLGAEAALLFPSGYHANLGLLGALAGPGDRILSDELNHASLVDGARLSRAELRVYGHLDLGHLERLLAAPFAGRTLVATESVFSMDGDLAPLAEIARLCARSGAELVVDEAHAAGVLGPEGGGGWEAARGETEAEPAARVVTGGKALGAAGAFAVGSAKLVEQLVNRARSFAYSTAAPPAVAGALCAAIPLARAADGERAWARGLARRVAAALGLPDPAGAIVPLVVGDADAALAAAVRLRERGLLVRAVRPPTVPEGTSRLRIVCHAHNTDAEVERLIAELGRLAPRRSPAAPRPRGARTVFVAGTDTGVGKTIVAALLARAAARRGGAHYWKPVQTGDEDDTAVVVRLSGAASSPPAHAFPLPASPHEAARAAGAAIDPARLAELLEGRERGAAGAPLLVELAGGLLVPLTDEAMQIDWLARRRPALVLVARSGLGTLNHTLLSLEALERRQLAPRALFVVGPPHPSNRRTLAARVPRLFEVPPFDPLDRPALDAWIDAHDLGGILGP
jgi:8-amino-7-oxononanoate synthase